jgi:tetratricopeptide (TPR) repeat protein
MSEDRDNRFFETDKGAHKTYLAAWEAKQRGDDGEAKMLYAKALQLFDKIEEIKRDESAWADIGHIYLLLGRLPDALKAFDNSISISPKTVVPFYNRACTYALLGRKQEAIADLQHAINLDPNLVKDNAEKDPDFLTIRDSREFQEILGKTQTSVPAKVREYELEKNDIISSKEGNKENVQLWRTVRVFISSTFRDMHAERDHLVRVVFPELRERCAARRLHLVDIDLRWGVTEADAEQGKVLDICLDEIDKSRPFFIAILGERYGYVPPKIPDDALADYPWLKSYGGHSLTALEIVHSVLRDSTMASRNFFYFRDSRVIDAIPGDKRTDYVSENPEAAQRVAMLKDKIRASGRPILENYLCHWDDVAGHLAGLEVFGERVLADLWAAIDAEHPAREKVIDPVMTERALHNQFIEERTFVFVGREAEMNTLDRYVIDDDRRPVVITGDSGCGKSAFLSSWCLRHTKNNPKHLVLPFFIGASSDSTDLERLLLSICSELKYRLALTSEIPTDKKRVPEIFASLLLEATEKRERIIIILDGLDQLVQGEKGRGLDWILDNLPLNARLITSTLAGEILDLLRRRDIIEMNIGLLSISERLEIIKKMLEIWRRKLDDRHIDDLIKIDATANPLYLKIALEELKISGRFETISAFIHSLPANVPDLFIQILIRLETDYGKTFVSKALSYIYCSRHGLSETELLDLLQLERKEILPRLLWARIARDTKAYLVKRIDYISYFHRQFGEAVRTRYSPLQPYHGVLASYFSNVTLERRVEEFPYQLEKAGQYDSLAGALTDLDMLDYVFTQKITQEWISYWHTIEGRADIGALYKASLDAIIVNPERTKDAGHMANIIGRILHDMGLYPDALKFYQQAKELDTERLGPYHPDVGSDLNNLAVLYKNMDNYIEALPCYQQALSISERVLGPNHPDVAIQLHNLALYLENQGKLSEAESLFQRAYAIGLKTLGAEDLEVAQALDSLSELYRKMARYTDAVSLGEQALFIREKKLGSNHLEVAQSLHGLAVIFRDQGKLSKALPLYERSLAIKEKILSPTHPSIASTLSNLAEILRASGRFNEAFSLFNRTLAIRERILGLEHSDVGYTLNNLAELYRETGRYSEALPLYKRAQTIFEKAFGESHPNVSKVISNLANLMYAQGNFDEALKNFRRALIICEKALGPNHPDVAVIIGGIAETLRAQKKYSEALPLYERALTIFNETRGAEHPDYGKILNNLAALFSDQGKFKEALPLFHRVVPIFEKAFGLNHPEVAISLNNLAGIYGALGEHEAALPLLQRAVTIAMNSLGLNHPITRSFFENLKACQESL